MQNEYITHGNGMKRSGMDSTNNYNGTERSEVNPIYIIIEKA